MIMRIFLVITRNFLVITRIFLVITGIKCFTVTCDHSKGVCIKIEEGLTFYIVVVLFSNRMRFIVVDTNFAYFIEILFLASETSCKLFCFCFIWQSVSLV